MVIPRHIAIIPDGNRRWAKQQGKNASYGHKAGAKRTQELVRIAADKGVEHLSIWGMSVENFTSRNPLEVQGLLQLFQEEFAQLTQSKEIHEREVKIHVLGRWKEKFPSHITNTIQAAVDATRNYSKHTLNFMLAYSGKDEMIWAIQNIVKTQPRIVTEDMVKQQLFTKELPSVDLLIRTGGEPHLSTGFMMWDIADAQLYFTDVYYPDFSGEEFDKALVEFAERERRYGK